MKPVPVPLHDSTAPICCTIGDDEVADRVELLERLRRELTALDRTDHGVLLHFPDRPDVAAEVRRFALDEKRCCAFWGFAVESTAEDLILRWDAPPDARELLDRITSYLEGDEPITAIRGLL